MQTTRKHSINMAGRRRPYSSGHLLILLKYVRRVTFACMFVCQMIDQIIDQYLLVCRSSHWLIQYDIDTIVHVNMSDDWSKHPWIFAGLLIITLIDPHLTAFNLICIYLFDPCAAYHIYNKLVNWNLWKECEGMRTYPMQSMSGLSHL